MTDRIHLGLDLKGGTHLILQVQVNDAVNADADRAIERLKDELRNAQDQLRRHQHSPIPVNNPDQHRRSRACRRRRPRDLRRIVQRPSAGIRRDLRRGEFLGL